MSSDGLTILSRLDTGPPVSEAHESSRVPFLRCVASFTDSSDPWTCESCRNSAHQLLEAFCHSLNSKDLSNALSILLQKDVKPAFANTRDSAINQQARMAIDPLPANQSPSEESDKATKPWKYREVYVVTVLGWIIRSLSLVDVSSCGPAFGMFFSIDPLAGVVHRVKLVATHSTTAGAHRRFVCFLQSERLCVPK